MPALCDAGVRCGAYASRSICEQVFSIYFVCATTPAHRDGRTVFDSTAANTCVNQLSGACDSPDLSVCVGTRGTGTINSPCYSGSGECESSLYCALNTCPGTCQPRTPIGSAPSTGAECAQGSYVYGGTCQAYVPVGQSCAPVSPEPGSRQCVSTAFCANGICVARRTAGQTCSAGQCAGLLTCWGGVCGSAGDLGAPCDTTRSCRYGYRCGNTNVCVAAGTVGSPCTSPFSDCEPQLICDIPFGQTQGTCSPIHTLGQSCTYSGYQCGLVGALYCTATSASPTGVCAMKKGQGASCTSYAECSSSSCSASNVCEGGCVDPTP